MCMPVDTVHPDWIKKQWNHTAFGGLAVRVFRLLFFQQVISCCFHWDLMSHCWIASEISFFTLQTFQTKIYQHNNTWETGKRVDEEFFIWAPFLSWKWLQTMQSDIVNYSKRFLATSWNIVWYFIVLAAIIGCCLIPMSHRAPLHILSFACRSYVSTNSFVWWGFASSWRSIWFFQWCKAWVSILCARVVAIHYSGALPDGGEVATYHDPLWTRNPYGIWPGTN